MSNGASKYLVVLAELVKKLEIATTTLAFDFCLNQDINDNS